MPPEVAALLCACLLLFPPSARTDLKVTVFPSVIQGKPRSTVELPCFILDTLKPIDLKQLAVIWKTGSNVIAKYEDTFEARRPGATMSVEDLQKGNATLLLPDVQDFDEGLYTCEAIYETNQKEGNVQLKIEAAPNVTHGSTKVQLGMASSVMCMASGFYPGDIFVTWLKDGKTVKSREKATAHLQDNGLFSAESILEFTPGIDYANSTISCKIEHKAIQQPLMEEFQLQVQAKPILEVVTLPSEKTFYAAECLVSRFYPEKIDIEWLQNGVQQKTLKSQLEKMSDGTFSINAVALQKTDEKSLFTCQVHHESLDTPMQKEVLWLPKGEGDSVTHHTSLFSQSPGKEQTAQSSCPTVVSLCPTDPPSVSFLPWLIGIIALVVGLAGGALVATFYYKNKAKHTTFPGGERKTLLAEAKNSEQDTSGCKAEKIGVGPHHKKDHPEQNVLEVKTESPSCDSAL